MFVWIKILANDYVGRSDRFAYTAAGTPSEYVDEIRVSKWFGGST